jgi:hypothetical protein
MYTYQNVEELIQTYLKGYVDVSGVFHTMWDLGQEDLDGFGDADAPLRQVCKENGFEVLGDLYDQDNTLIVHDSLGYAIVADQWGPCILRLTDELIEEYNTSAVNEEMGV